VFTALRNRVERAEAREAHCQGVYWSAVGLKMMSRSIALFLLRCADDEILMMRAGALAISTGVSRFVSKK